ncbi:DUF6922 domain-containing protein [Prosthecobacter dejongeii]|uniref:DUF6922 domain-containing protein n=1 Tax=Prosthecobacter dejongeii TaxID=48465 RepID=A0A7W7YKV3_9BACT|nr:hypothetical protein [Prosthecobacter dejongeii]
MISPTEKPKTPLGLPRALFWDARPESLDLDRHARQIIGRVVERGGLEGWHKLRSHYGDEKLKQVVTTLRTLEPRTVNFLCLMLNLKKEDFRCCTSQPFPSAPSMNFPWWEKPL